MAEPAEFGGSAVGLEMAICAIMCGCDSMSFDVLVNQFCSLQNGYTAVFYHCKQYPHQLALTGWVGHVSPRAVGAASQERLEPTAR